MTQNKRSTSWSCLILIAWLCTTVPTDAQSITWDNTYELMIASPTKSVFVHGQESIIFTSKVNVAGPNYTMDRAHFEIKQHGSHYVTLCYVDLSNCGGYEVSNCYCHASNERNIVSVVLNLTADTYFSEAFLQGTIYHFDIKIKSKELKLPYILDLSHTGIHVYINDKIDQLDLCNKTMNQTTALIVVERANNELQYSFSLQDKKTSIYLKNATNFLFHVVEIKEETVFRITYHIFENPKIRTSIECTVRLLQKTEGAGEINNIIIIIVSCVFVIGLIVAILTIFLRKTRRRQFRIRNKKSSDNEGDVEIELRLLTKTRTEQTFRSIGQRMLRPSVSLLTSKLSNDQHNDQPTLLSTSNVRYPLQKNIMESEEVTDIGKVKVDREMIKDRVSCVTPELDSPVGVTLPSEILTIIKDMKNVEDKKEAENLKPEPMTYDSIKDLINSQLDLMVILSINNVSETRPETWPGFVIPYPSHYSSNDDVKRGLRTGIGRIVSVKSKEHDGKKKYQRSTNEFPYLVEINVYTSRHIVFDDEEAKKTDVTLMIEGTETPGAVLKGKCVRMASILQNWTLFTCVSNDIEIFKFLRHRVQRFNEEWSKINENNSLFNIINECGYIISIGERSIESMVKANFTKLLDIYKKDRFHKKTSYTLNTQFNNENVAIYVERTSESVICGLPEEFKLTFPPDFGNEKWIIGSIPLVIKNLSIQDKEE
ncbi:hypothetical protein Bpfe_003513 [Biomphalaria pfeifferi]|uniref:Cadherin domain-containing protein n=1 Tax=Biomphalaria pfeifferi TaxID=112525 RepID=A0AAD8C5V7_BIOPF|nr:hypothetical protein Bpfe_003513 [Biomphalaria pfeifferi]